MFLYKTPWIVQKLYPSLTWRRNQRQTIYLTFDDGPIPVLTPFIQNTLKDFEIKATFFCVGDNLRKYQEIAQESFQQGHKIANHTYNHLNGWKTNKIDYLNNIEQCKNIIEKIGDTGRLFRPPYGRISKGQISQVKKKYEIVMWDVLTGDFSSNLKPLDCLQNSINATDHGSIVLFHDNIKAEKNLRYCLPRFIEYFMNQDFQFGTL